MKTPSLSQLNTRLEKMAFPSCFPTQQAWMGHRGPILPRAAPSLPRHARWGSCHFAWLFSRSQLQAGVVAAWDGAAARVFCGTACRGAPQQQRSWGPTQRFWHPGCFPSRLWWQSSHHHSQQLLQDAHPGSASHGCRHSNRRQCKTIQPTDVKKIIKAADNYTCHVFPILHDVRAMLSVQSSERGIRGDDLTGRAGLILVAFAPPTDLLSVSDLQRQDDMSPKV